MAQQWIAACGLFFAILLVNKAQGQTDSETAHNDAFCAAVSGQREVRHDYTYPTGQSHVFVDCETQHATFEGGLDNTRSSLDSTQQALFFAWLTGKEPAVVIYDTDGRIGRFEYRIRIACEFAGVWFIRWPHDRDVLREAIRDMAKNHK